MTDKLKISIPVQGWKQLLTSRKEILDAVDQAREKARSHEVETYHGKVAEAQLRKWLSEFLPKRYGVTSGYILSPGLSSEHKLPHFDVIIYDQLESPVLWIEGDPDTSAQGRSLAIPAEHVKCVLEVKMKFTSSNVKEAIEHLNDLAPLLSGHDDPKERYKLHLPNDFCCGLVFVELDAKNQFKPESLNKLLNGLTLRGFFGGIILRGENHPKPLTGKLSLARCPAPFEGTIGSEEGKTSLLDSSAMTGSVKIADDIHIGSLITWSEVHFSQFGFDLIAMAQGKYDPGFTSSFYGIGGS